MSPRLKNTLFFILKLMLGIIILGVVVWKVQHDQGSSWSQQHQGENLWMGMWKLILSSRWQFIVLGVIVNILAMLQVVFRWHDLLTCHGSKIKIFETTKILAVSYLYNNLLPASLGMDAVRVAYAYSKIRKKGEVVSSVLADRLLGFVGMLMMGVLAVPFYWNAPLGKYIFFLEIAGLLGLVAFLWIFSHRSLKDFYTRMINKIKFWGIGEKSAKFYQALRSYADKPGTVLRVIFFSMMLQLLLTINMYVLAKAIYIDNLTFGILLGYLPFINIVAMIPTPGGLGPREAGAVMLFGKAGVSSPLALTLSLLFYVVGLVVSFSGIVFMPFLKFSEGELDEK